MTLFSFRFRSPFRSSSLRSRKGRASWERYAAFFLVGIAVLFGAATYAAMTEVLPVENNSEVIIWLLNFDLVILLLLLSLTASRIMTLWYNRRKGVAGSQLQTRLVLIFAVLAAVPAIIMTIFSAYFFHYGIQTWFSDRVRTAVIESQAVAEAYLNEHQQVIRSDILAMAQDLNRNAEKLKANPQGFQRYMKTQVQFRNFTEAVVFNKGQNLYVQAGPEGLPVNLSPEEVLKEAERGKVVLMTAPHEDRVRALVELEGFDNSYLYVARAADPTVLSRVNMTRAAAAHYNDLEQRHSELQIRSLMLFIVVATILILAAVWAGLVLAQQMTVPVTSLINAAERVRSGDLSVRVPEYESLDELDYLARAFNRMTSQISAQRDELMGANRQLDHRRRFTETILAGVSVGVMGVDPAGRITIANQPATALFLVAESDPKSLVGRLIGEIVPGLPELLEAAHQKPNQVAQYELPYINPAQIRRNLLVRIAFEFVGEQDVRAVITFDDITELQSAQRKAAWSDVARRIAHEIKNPLTPIQLSAERLRRRYAGQITDKPEVFEQCIETIIRQVSDIGRMVNEFSSFARMPEPILKMENLHKLLEECIFLHKQAHPDVIYEVHIHPQIRTQDLMVPCDAQQVRQALTNLIRNALDSIEESAVSRGCLRVFLWREADHLILCLNDNGKGLPEGIDVAKLTEPYVTFKEKGTGLGLAIVKKIMEDHKGRLVIGVSQDISLWEDYSLGSGAVISLKFPVACYEKMPEQVADDTLYRMHG
ncbi:MAG: PAS domain-containing sensor histidine kinase [Rhodospirillales bacterium]|nr:PAS domain-containing sensor histidine kinase [Rhodospirillales bacterium]MCB9965023.1 PAS domain-containing sensor histidine kinase [Rhodospirillales bacterium]